MEKGVIFEYLYGDYNNVFNLWYMYVLYTYIKRTCKKIVF